MAAQQNDINIQDLERNVQISTIVGCPSILPHECNWEGALVDVATHFAQKHPKLVPRKVKLELDLQSNTGSNIIFTKDTNSYLIKYKYSKTKMIFSHALAHFPSNSTKDVLYSIKIGNNLGQTIILENFKSKPLNSRFVKMQFSVLNLCKYLKMLQGPKEIKISFKLQERLPQFGINHGMMTRVKCLQCEQLLKTFKKHNKTAFSGCICLNKIQRRCPWLRCGFMGHAKTICAHERSCDNRLYRCNIEACTKFYKKEQIYTHLNSHKYVYFTHGVVHEMPKKSEFVKNYFTVFKNEIILVIVDKTVDGVKCSLRGTGNCEKTAIDIYVSHEDCKKSSFVKRLQVCDEWELNDDDLSRDCVKCNNVSAYLVMRDLRYCAKYLLGQL